MIKTLSAVAISAFIAAALFSGSCLHGNGAKLDARLVSAGRASENGSK